MLGGGWYRKQEISLQLVCSWIAIQHDRLLLLVIYS